MDIIKNKKRSINVLAMMVNDILDPTFLQTGTDMLGNIWRTEDNLYSYSASMHKGNAGPHILF